MQRSCSTWTVSFCCGKTLFYLALPFLALIFTAGLTYAAAVDLPQTGQTACYDPTGNPVACAGTGQDGEKLQGVIWPVPRFTDNGDQTITDGLTGLIWAGNGNIIPARDAGWDTDDTVDDGAVTWQHAFDYVAWLNAGSYLGSNDWRLPNVNELESLINAGLSDTSSWLNTQGFTDMQAWTYWTSTTNTAAVANAFSIYMDSGTFLSEPKDNPAYTNYVLPVRGTSDLAAQVWRTG